MARVESPGTRHRRRVRTPVLALTAIAWAAQALLLVRHGSGQPAEGSMDMTMPVHHHAMDHATSHAHGDSLAGFVAMWPLMLVAMMAPLLIAPIRHLRDRSLSRRRGRGTFLFVASYGGVWTAGGLVLFGVAKALGELDAAIAVALGAAMLWQLTPAKQRCLNRRHAHPPLAAFGRKADLDAMRFGATHALWCFGSCWALMLLPLLFESAAALAVMAIVTLWMWAEQFDRPVRATWRLRAPVRAARIMTASVR